MLSKVTRKVHIYDVFAMVVKMMEQIEEDAIRLKDASKPAAVRECMNMIHEADLLIAKFDAEEKAGEHS